MILAEFRTDPERRAFILGLAFYLGYYTYLERNLVKDEHFEKPIFKYSKEAHKAYAIDPKTGKTSGLGENRPKQTPSFNCSELQEYYDKNASAKGYRATLKSYLLHKFANTEIKNPKGLPIAQKIKFSPSGLAKTASSIKSGYEWVLPRLPEIYLSGVYAGKEAPRDGKHSEAKWIHYTDAVLSNKGKKYKVTGNVIEKNDGSLEFVHYTVKPIVEIK